MTSELVSWLNLAVTTLGGLTGFGVVTWHLRRVQADRSGLRTDFRDLRADIRQFRDENARQQSRGQARQVEFLAVNQALFKHYKSEGLI